MSFSHITRRQFQMAQEGVLSTVPLREPQLNRIRRRKSDIEELEKMARSPIRKFRRAPLWARFN